MEDENKLDESNGGFLDFLGLDQQTVAVLGGMALVGITYYWWKNRSEQTLSTKPVLQSSPKTPKPKNKETNKELEGCPKLSLFFGSQTGTAEDFANKLAAEGKRYKFNTHVYDLEDYDMDDLEKEENVIFVMATYGEGEPTDNAREFTQWLMDPDRPADMLKNTKFTVFGLGNKTYEIYNEMGRKYNKRLEELGGTRMFKLGEGDDDSSLEDDFAAWKKELWPSLCKQFGIEIVDNGEEVMNERKYKIINHGVGVVKPVTKFITKRPNNIDTTYDAKNPYIAKVTVNRELHTEHSGRSCRHIEIELGKGSSLHYEVGDHLGVYPENDQSLVEELAKRLGMNLDEMFTLVPIARDSKMPKVGPCSVRQALTQYVDITTPPRKSALRVLALHATNPEEKARLQLLSDDSKVQPYTQYIKDDQRTIIEVLNEFPSVTIPFDLFLETVPRLAARYYSISSSMKEHPNSVHITAVVVNYDTATKRKHRGVCSNYLTTLAPGSEVPIYMHKSTFRVPKNPEIPVIMVGPGTGLAPFRGFIFERKAAHNTGKKTENILFFGCRAPNHDFIYRDELETFHDEGHIKLFVAYSRFNEKKVYVQHKIEENEEEIWNLLNEKKAHLYICGDARAMAKDVHQALTAVIMKFGGKTPEEAEEYLNNMVKVGRYQTDVWF